MLRPAAAAGTSAGGIESSRLASRFRASALYHGVAHGAWRVGREGSTGGRLLIGGGVGRRAAASPGASWPRHYAPNLRAAPGETLLNAFLKIGSDGRVIVAVPQAELGQGVWTSLPQILADELGADWRTVGGRAGAALPLYANQLARRRGRRGQRAAGFLRGVGRWAAQDFATRNALMITGGSTSVRAFEAPLREAGAGARALLCMAAARRWDVDWEALDTA